MEEDAEKIKIGFISHYYGKIGVAVLELEDELAVGDTISIEGPSTSFTQTVDSMEIEHKKVQVAKPGQSIGMKVSSPVKEKDTVFKVIE
ncbi:MAG: U32 family peptidase C-terminal domain-containing protein [Candidatus Aenigmatarchaeota archaeon]